MRGNVSGADRICHNASRHPDKNASAEAEGGAKFQRISAAYQHLINPPKPKRRIIVNMGATTSAWGRWGLWGLIAQDRSSILTSGQ